jgi:hypothetical protein
LTNYFNRARLDSLKIINGYIKSLSYELEELKKQDKTPDLLGSIIDNMNRIEQLKEQHGYALKLKYIISQFKTEEEKKVIKNKRGYMEAPF